jgi:Protein of unknown function (DUF2934)
MAAPPEPQPRSFDAPQESDWHRMIAEAAYYLAQKREFHGEHSLDDWLHAERQIREVISPSSESEAPVKETIHQPELEDTTPRDKHNNGTSKFAKFAATQAAGDGIQGDVRKPDKTVDEKIGANMPDRK